MSMLIRALTDDACNIPDALRMYVAPTLDTAKEAAWNKLLSIGQPVIKAIHVNDAVVTLINGQRIRFRGADRPQSLRGAKLADVVLDEYADMKPEVWDEVLEPATADLDGTVTFIGSPTGRNHFYDLYRHVELHDDPEWSAWHFTTYDNPMISRARIEKAKNDPKKSSFAFRQEYMASFEAAGSEIFKEEWVKFSTKGNDGMYYVAVDLAGFEELGKKNKTRRLDSTAISVVKVDETGWFVEDIIHGRWDLKETAQKIFDAVKKYQPVSVGIEKGIAKQAVMSPLTDLMKRYNRFFVVQELTHGNQKKTDRIVWALQGRFENGYITLNKGDWNLEFLDQLYQFPNPLVHDDLIDSLAYIDQLQSVVYNPDIELDDWEEIDAFAGY